MIFVIFGRNRREAPVFFGSFFKRSADFGQNRFIWEGFVLRNRREAPFFFGIFLGRNHAAKRRFFGDFFWEIFGREAAAVFFGIIFGRNSCSDKNVIFGRNHQNLKKTLIHTTTGLNMSA